MHNATDQPSSSPQRVGLPASVRKAIAFVALAARLLRYAQLRSARRRSWIPSVSDEHRKWYHGRGQAKGVTVIPGDYVYADSAGAVIVPANAIVKALEEAARIESIDAQYIEKIKRENAQEILERGSQEQ